MTPRPVIFISAASRELKTARQLVANTLTFLGYEPEWQDIFGADQGDLREMLQRRIDASAGVVQLIGQSYGAEPTEPDPQFGRVSYTQFEALYARKRGKKVWPLLLDETFVGDPGADEPEELRELQRAYRKKVRGDVHIFAPIRNEQSLEVHVHKLRDELAQFRRKAKRWSIAVLVTLTALTAAVVWLAQSQREQARTVRTQTENFGVLLNRQQKVEQALVRLAETESAVKQSGDKLSPDQLRVRAYALLEKDLGLPLDSLAKELPGLALELYARADTTPLLRARAAYALNKFEEAEKLSLEAAAREETAYEKAKQVADQRRRAAVEGYELAGQSAQNAIRYNEALRHYRKAEKLTDQNNHPRDWVRVQRLVVAALIDAGKYDEAEPLAAAAKSISDGKLGAIDPETLAIWHSWALALYRQGKFAVTEKQYRAMIARFEPVVGPDDSNLLTARNGLALTLDDQGKHAEAEQELRAVLASRVRVLGPENRYTLATRNNLAIALFDQGKYAEAETEHRARIPIEERILGSEHPDTLLSRMNLANAMMAQGKHNDAEQELRAVRALYERVLGPDHPDTLATRNNLAKALYLQEKFADAEAETRALLSARTRVLGPDHPKTLRVRGNLALMLVAGGRKAEAEREFRMTLAILDRVMGPEDPDTLSCRYNLANALTTQERYDEAEKEHRAVLAVHERVRGRVHPLTLDSYASLAEVLKNQRKLGEALTYVQRAEDGRRRLLGENHPDTREAAKYRALIEEEIKKAP